MALGQSPVVMPPAPTGLGDLALLLRVLDNKEALKAHLDEVMKARAEADAVVALVGKAKDIDAAHAEIEKLKASAAADAAAVAREAEKSAALTLRDAAQKDQAADVKLTEAAKILDEAKDDAKKRNAKCLERERAVEEAEALAVTRAAELASEAAGLDNREAAISARERAIAEREAKLKAALA